MAGNRRVVLWLILLGSGVLSLTAFLLANRAGFRPNLGQIVMPGVLSLALLNITVFVTNSALAFSAARRSGNQRQMETELVPALRGEPNRLKGRVLVVFQHIIAVNAGEIAGSLAFAVLRLSGVV